MGRKPADAKPRGKTGAKPATKPRAKKPAAETATNRRETGQFGPGNCANPGGRPKLPPELKEAARAASPEALEILIAIMRNTESHAAARIRAAEIVMNRAYGTPPASVEITKLSELPPIIYEVPDGCSPLPPDTAAT